MLNLSRILDCFSRRFDKVVFNLKLWNLVDSGGFQSGPQYQLELKVNASTHWTTPVNADNMSLKKVYIPSLW